MRNRNIRRDAEICADNQLSVSEAKGRPSLTEIFYAAVPEHLLLHYAVKNGLKLDPNFIDSIKVTIRKELSARHVPSLILAVPDIPYTVNGKKVEIPVRRILEGQKVCATGSLMNPDCLEYFRHIPELSQW
ncbi:unnamed protein product [Didymodactylos carnosus]|uniref:Acetoacetyl-CoA synthetase n=1 Tax=Didymodactylos carnosus TaxID=1234261 RepID=A0A813WEN5_9BILA|nr:unnamed protein product [Didymodactylos carnosus]CAF1092962.1 unnamed protein product [Didymodactylos carnosus]CAF3637296.1 unnamed protein product [Didymodactylos carnosus]CAF3854507.1 unnamed protein product [Didymodactylos carnosus]